jgi:hypothetical protein
MCNSFFSIKLVRFKFHLVNLIHDKILNRIFQKNSVEKFYSIQIKSILSETFYFSTKVKLNAYS